MYFYLAHQIEHVNKKHTYQYDDEGNTVSESLETTSSKMVNEDKRLKVISSKTPIELGEEVIENHNDLSGYNDFYWEERWIILQELTNINFWRM